MGNLFSNIIGEFRTVHVPVYTTPDDYNLLIRHRRDLIKIVDHSECKLNEEQKQILEDIRNDQS